LILDEATSALDAESETLVNQALAALLRGNNTTISIAHRLSTIKRSDHIICLSSDGRVAEEGSYEVLSNRDGPFKRLMEWQISGGDDPSKVVDVSSKISEDEAIEADLKSVGDEEKGKEVDASVGQSELERRN
jgi:putative ABC transport system ATP-binding protein